MRVLLAFCAVCCGLCHSFALFADSASGSLGGRVGFSTEGSAIRGWDDGFTLGGELLFYGWGGHAVLPEFSTDGRPISSFKNSIKAKGRASKDFGWEGDCDFIGGMTFEYAADSGMLYGADFQLLVPEVGSAVEGSGKAIVNRGSRVFVLTSYGKFSLGYQEGVESIISFPSPRGNVFDDFVRGRDPTLMKYKLPMLKGGFFSHGEGWWWLRGAALLYPGLYSESVFRENSLVDYYGADKYSRHYSRYFANSLPFRFSYQSPTFFGVKFGLSYSPTGYDAELFRGYYYEDVLQKGERWEFVDGSERVGVRSAQRSAGVRRKSVVGDALAGDQAPARVGIPDVPAVGVSRVILADDVLYAPAYKNVVSAALSVERAFRLGGEEVKVGAAFAAEWAPATEAKGYGDIAPDSGFCTLAAVGMSASVEAGGVDFGFGYGHLGSSGYPRGPLVGSTVDWGRGKADSTWRPSSYFVVGVGYGSGPLRAELSYFTSVKGGYVSLAEVDDFGVRLGYDLYKSVDMRCVLFAQLHRVSVEYDFARGLVGKSWVDSHLSYDFDVLMSGVKLVF
ncbi:hypothetical protein ACIS_00556 [Anaplasma centrale str. Israel]|uniref:Uncharacterized protein n=1 Tax=Anaplasma centrale (strain Israel) TaxID=574556 RepID=D1AUD4_ANACI|nr:porin [Anaplasma centrale]ACZ49162.1 hypothetical protein ACIS_00556 [Anaplasma centrale str. Israel]